MASTAALASTTSAFLAAPFASVPSTVASNRTSFCRVTCSAQQSPVSRKVATSLAAAAAVALLAGGPIAEPAQAKDIPLFGIKKKAAKAVDEAKEAVGEATEAAKEASGSFFDIFSGNAPSLSAPTPKISTPEDKLTRAGAVVAADVIALLVASSVVGGLLKPSS